MFLVSFLLLACHSSEFVGSCKMCNLVSFEVICNRENLVFQVVILYSADVLVVCEIPEFFMLEPGCYVPCEVTFRCFMVDEFFLQQYGNSAILLDG